MNPRAPSQLFSALLFCNAGRHCAAALASAALLALASCQTIPGPDAAEPAPGASVIAESPDEPPVVEPESATPAAENTPPSSASGAYRVAVDQSAFTVANPRGQDPGAGGRVVLLTKDTELTPLGPTDSHRTKVRLASGRIGYVFSNDIEPVPAPAEVVSVPVLDESTAQPGFPISKPPRPIEPIDPALLREANQLDMPAQ